ncbi:D-isomer specific 2-hydroxyacid dehydrogenase, NAD-binding protein [Bifidobacterium bombi DSM 19703]|uniref:D-isomer specific 2-hydroxyacid dehydrogenase, NAD-binding protein n=2 Tax=Bifidobacterium bombi TaxID=471511 RepID=A0A080N4F7_9BIFI|nr:D-isomer specific 2-hydroxyacid dehydrogenase, NAD-binding protein [Bifidobacterium bombi DSM 19703]
MTEQVDHGGVGESGLDENLAGGLYDGLVDDGRVGDERLILDCVPMNESDKARLRCAAGDVPVVFNDRPELFGSMHTYMEVPRRYGSQVTAVIGNIAPDVAAGLPRLQWLQTSSAGVDKYSTPGLLGSEVSLTSASGAFGQAVGEHMFAMMWSLMNRLPAYARLQYEGRWQEGGNVLSPRGKRALVLGTGDIGSYFASLAKSVAMSTDGVRRDAGKSAANIDTMHTFDELDELIPQADVIAMALPASPATHHLIDARRIALMKPTAVLINAGRGDGVDCEALAAALGDGAIFGAGLDVTDPEPLPPDNPLWNDPRCLITPHVAGGAHLAATTGRIIDIVVENTRRYVCGEPLKNLVRH